MRAALHAVVDRLQYWKTALQAGAVPVNTVAAIVSVVVLAAGVAGIVVPLVVSHVPRWLAAVILLALLLFVATEGGFRVSVLV